MGFCLFNNVAVAAALAIARARRSSACSSSTGTCTTATAPPRCSATRSDVLFASIHQSPLYPGTGRSSDVGSGAGEGYTINLPVPPGSGEELWLSLLEHVVLPAARGFEPELVLVSGGFDAHAGDPLARCLLETESFVAMAGADAGARRGAGRRARRRAGGRL